MKETLKSKKGITLIALIITIIVLIILAGISIAILGGEDGLIEKTKEAGRKQKIADIKEKIGLELMNAETDAILRGEQLEVAQRDDIASKYGTVNGDILTTTNDNYEIDLKEIYNKTLSESGSYTALKQALANKTSELETSEANLQAAQMTQSEASAALTELQTNVNNGTVEADKMLKDYTAYKNGAYVTGTIESKTAQTYTPGTTDQIITAGQYLSGDQTIKGDANLVAGNIKSGVEIFGVTGTAPSETTHTETYTFPANDTGGQKDLGVNHSYRYVNASNVYNKGKADGRSGYTASAFSATNTVSCSVGDIVVFFFGYHPQGNSAISFSGGTVLAYNWQDWAHSSGYHVCYVVKATSTTVKSNCNASAMSMVIRCH